MERNIPEYVEHVNEIVDMFVDAVRGAADGLFHHVINVNSYQHGKDKPMWADNDWKPLKKTFLRSKDKHNRNPSEANRINLINSRTEYRSYINRRQYLYEKSQTRKLLEAKLNNVKLYWRMLKEPTKKSVSYQISNKEFKDYFMKLSDPGDDFFRPDASITEELNEMLTSELECAYEELNCEISCEEINKAIKALKSGKSAGEDLLLNEFFIHGSTTLMPYIQHLFNYIFSSGIFPSVWSDGLLVPLYKKGSSSNPDNFRGITLLSTLGKLFTRLLNMRYNDWAENYRIYVEAQYGFRAGRGTTDCIFILHNAINNFIESGQELYTLFVDFSKAFDRVVYDNLWF